MKQNWTEQERQPKTQYMFRINIDFSYNRVNLCLK